MESQAWLESSLRRSASLGLEVLERASRRSVDWTNTGPSQTSTTTDEETQVPVKRTHTDLDNVFANIADLMTQMTNQCKRFYGSGCCTDSTDTERSHVFRFHDRMTTPPTRKHTRALHNKGNVSPVSEDFFIEVSPGTYTVTAGMPDSQQQTQLVSVKAGESVDLTFNL